MTISCPACGERTTVYDSRAGLHGWWKRRRRCLGCAERFTTLEIPAQTLRTEVEMIVSEVIGNAPGAAGARIYQRMIES